MPRSTPRRPPWWLAWLLCLSTGALGWVGHHLLTDMPSGAGAVPPTPAQTAPPPACVDNIPASEGLYLWAGGEWAPWSPAVYDCDSCPEVELCPALECPLCPELVWDCEDNPCRPPPCPECDSRPSISIGWEDDFTSVVCYYDEPGGPVEASRVSLYDLRIEH